MSTTLAYFKLYIKAGWPITLVCTLAALPLVVWPQNLGMGNLSLWVNTCLLALLGILLAGITFRFAAPDILVLSSGAPPARRLAALLLAYITHAGFFWLMASLCIWLRARSLVQQYRDSLVYPEAAPREDALTLFWALVLALAVLLFLELRLRLAAGAGVWSSLALSTIASLAGLGLLWNLQFTLRDIWSFEAWILLAACIMLATRLFNIVRLHRHPSANDASLPIDVRICDALLLLIGINIPFAGSLDFVASPGILRYHSVVPGQWPLVLAAHAVALACALLAAVAYCRNKIALASFSVCATLLVLAFPCQWANKSYLGPVFRHYSQTSLNPDDLISRLSDASQHQAITAWMLLHPTQTASAPLIKKAGGEAFYVQVLKNLDPADQKSFLDQLQLDSFNAGKPVTPAAAHTIVSTIIDRSRTHSIPLIEEPMLRKCAPMLSSDELACIIQSNLSSRTFFTGLGASFSLTPAPLQTTFDLWLAAHADDEDSITRLANRLAPALIATGNCQILAALGTPVADTFFRKAMNHSSYTTSGYEGFNHPLILGATMPGGLGRAFRKDYAPQLIDFIIQHRITNKLGPWFPKALGGSDEPVYQAYWQWVLTNPAYPGTLSKGAFSPITELSDYLRQTDPEPYLQVLANPARHIPPPVREDGRPYDPETVQANYFSRLQSVLGDSYNHPERRELFRKISSEIRQNPARYGLPDSSGRNVVLNRVIDRYIDPDPPLVSSAQFQGEWLVEIAADLSLAPSEKDKALTRIIQSRQITWESIPHLAAHADPIFRRHAPDLIIRWPTPQNLTLLAKLAADPDPTVAARAKTAQKFIDELKSLPLDQLPDPNTPQAIRFFDLTRLEK